MSRIRPLLVNVVAMGVLGVALCACRMEGGMSIPSSARMMAEGNRDLSFTAQDPGTVYVYDATDDRILYTGRVESGDKVSLSPADNRLRVGGRTALESGLNQNHQVRIYFEPR